MEYDLQNKSSARKNVVVAYSIFSAWMLAFVFEGQVLYSLAEKADIDGSVMVLPAILAQFLGLFCCGFFVKQLTAA